MVEVRKASRKRAKMRLGIAAPAGAGKTMGALLVAYGLVGDWSKIGLADTEMGSGELYVEHRVPGTDFIIGEFNYVGIDAPYTVAKYVEAQRALEKAGCEVVILDSISHAWAGQGGLLDKQGKVAAKSGNSYTAWRDVTPEHNLFIETMLSSPAHLIATMRSKTEHVIGTANGKQTVSKVGMAPIQRDGMDYEMTVVFDLDVKHNASASKDRTSLFDGEFFRLTPEVGKKMLAWLNSGAEPAALPPSSVTAPPPDKATAVALDLYEAFTHVASTEEYNTLVLNEKTIAQLAWLEERRPELFKQVDTARKAALARVEPAVAVDPMLGGPPAETVETLS